jgi:hypothetical protein
MSADTCPHCGQPMPSPTPRPRRTQATYHPYPGGADDLPGTLAEYRSIHGCDPKAILVGIAPDGLDAVDGVPVVADPIVAKPAGYAYLEVAP